jgi:hypothetical protein
MTTKKQKAEVMAKKNKKQRVMARKTKAKGNSS